MTNTEQAYFAGIVDGEGSIGALIVRKQIRWAQPVISIGNTNFALLSWIREHIPIPFDLSTNPATEHNKAQFKVYWKGRRAIEVARLVLPQLLLKRRQAELIIEMEDINEIHNPLPRRYGRGNELPAAVVAARERIVPLLTELNRTGPKK